MFKISTIHLEGFWDNKPINIQVDNSVCFLIGQNGSGKTNLINIIASALTGDIRALEYLPFTKISIELFAPNSVRRPKIQVVKQKEKQVRGAFIKYTFNNGRKGERDKVVNIPDFNQRVHFSFRDDSEYLTSPMTHFQLSLAKSLKELAVVNWLSVHRMPSQYGSMAA